MGAHRQPRGPRERILDRTAVTAAVVVVVGSVAGLLGYLVVPYALNLVSLPAIAVVWLLAVVRGVQQRRPVLFVLGLALLPAVGFVALAASFALPEQVSTAELPFVLGMYLLGPVTVVVTGGVVLAGPTPRDEVSPRG